MPKTETAGVEINFSLTNPELECPWISGAHQPGEPTFYQFHASQSPEGEASTGRWRVQWPERLCVPAGMKLPKQRRAAKAWLEWDQDELAIRVRRCGKLTPVLHHHGMLPAISCRCPKCKANQSSLSSAGTVIPPSPPVSHLSVSP